MSKWHDVREASRAVHVDTLEELWAPLLCSLPPAPANLRPAFTSVVWGPGAEFSHVVLFPTPNRLISNRLISLQQ